MGRFKNYLALAVLIAASIGCEKDAVDPPQETAKDLSFVEFVNSGVDFNEYLSKIAEKERSYKNIKSHSDDLLNPDENYFSEFCSNLPVEDFEEGNIPVGSAGLVAAPLSEHQASGKFEPGEIEPGLIITTDNLEVDLALYGDTFRGSNTKVITSRANQELILIFTEEDVYSVGLDISSFPYPESNSSQEVTIQVRYKSGAVHEETITASVGGTFWGITGDQEIEQIIIFSTNEDAWVGVDNVAFGTCEIPDADFDGCADDEDPNDESNIEQNIVIGNCNSGVANRMTSACGVTLADEVDNFEAENFRNHGQLVREFASITNNWVAEGLISSEEKDLLMSCAAKAGM